MDKNTFIAYDSDGSKRGFLPGRFILSGIGGSVKARYCTCDIDTNNISEIADWDTSQDCLITNAMKLDYIDARNECSVETKAALQALEKILKVAIRGMSE